MDTNRGDVGIAIRSAFLSRGTQQRFSLFILTLLSALLIFVETFESKPLNIVRSAVKDFVYRSAIIVSYPLKSFSGIYIFVEKHINLYNNYDKLIKENQSLKDSINKSDYLELENTQLRKLVSEQIESPNNLVSARVMLDNQSPYLNSFIINIGSNKDIKNGMAALDGKNFIGRIVDVNFFSSRILLVTDLNSKIPIVSQPSASHAILSGHGKNALTLDYLSKDNKIQNGDTIYTSGKEGIFDSGIPIGLAKIEKNKVIVSLFSDLNQITFVNINFGKYYKSQ